MDEWAKALLSAGLGLLAGLMLDPLKAMFEKWKLRKRLYYEIIYMQSTRSRAFLMC